MYRPIQRQWLGIWAFALLLVGLFHAMTAQAGMTLAGTVIKNLATVSYQDAAGNKYQATSNESIVTVAEVYAAELQQTQTKNGAAGQTVYFPHRLINTGNVQDAFTLTLEAFQHIQKKDLTIYRDVNGDGLPNAGEPEITDGEKVFVAAGGTANLVVAAVLPANITTDISPSFNLTAMAVDRVSDASSWSEANTDTIKVVNGAVLVATKEVRGHKAATDTDPGSVTYKITIRNNGSDLTLNDNARIEDSLSSLLMVSKGKVTVGDSNTTGIKVDFIDSRFNAASFEVTDASGTDPYQHDFKAQISIRELKAGSTLALEYTVQYRNTGFVAGDVLQNIASVIHGAQGGTTVKTNMTTVKLPQFYGVEAHDRTAADSNHSHESTDTDTVDSIAKGEVAEFRVLIKNTGNGADRYSLSVGNATAGKGNNFPANTEFTFWDSIGAVQYTDNKTPVIGHGQSTMITIKAKLPDGVSAKTVDYTAQLQATSIGDTQKSASVLLKLVEITDTKYGVDISYTKKTEDVVDKDPYSQSSQDATNKQTIVAGKSGVYTLWVRNESSKPQTFSLSAYQSVSGNSPNGYAKGVDLPDGWKVVFLNNGMPVNSTGYIKPNESLELNVQVTLPANVSVATHEFAVLAQTADGSIDDAIRYFVEVPVTGELTLTPDGQNQIEPGGAVFYNHELRNLSNDQIQGDITLEGEGLKKGWSYQIFNVDENGQVQGAGQLQMTIPGSSLTSETVYRIKVKVMAPANASPGVTTVLTLKAKYQLGTESDQRTAIATDSTTVIKGQIRLYKKVKVLSGDGKTVEIIKKEAESLNTGDFATNSTKKVTPNQDYVVWQIIARNEGDADAKQVTIRDAAPEFTSLVDGSAIVKTDQMGVVAEENTTSGDVVFNIGHGATIDKDSNGTLKPGESVEVRFTVKVN